MKQPILSLLTIAALCFPAGVLADSRLAPLEAVAQAAGALQPGLESYQATVRTDRIAAMIQTMTASMPADMPRPEVPTVVKYWRRGASRSVIAATGAQSSPFVQQMVQRISASLTIEPEELVLPPGKSAERQRLAEQATIKSTETVLADKVLQQVELRFAATAELGDSFYGQGLRLPRTGVTRLQFDIDARSRTVSELAVQTAAGDQYLAEFRYRPLPGGMIAERVRVTSPDGKIDDRLDVTFAPVAGFILPETTARSLNRPGLREQFTVTFSDYLVNRTFPPEIEALFARPLTPAAEAP